MGHVTMIGKFMKYLCTVARSEFQKLEELISLKIFDEMSIILGSAPCHLTN
jgi:hypothetical protein